MDTKNAGYFLVLTTESYTVWIPRKTHEANIEHNDTFLRFREIRILQTLAE
jgi:hypothetical protein